MTKKFLLMLVPVVLAYSTLHAGNEGTEASGSAILKKMLLEIKKVKTMTFVLKSWERHWDKEIFSEVHGKLNVDPVKMYLLSKAPPHNGVQVIYNEPLYEKKALVKPKALFPIKLSPYGSKMRKDQHHTILNTGFSFLGKIVLSALKRAQNEEPDQMDKIFKNEGEVTFDGRPCYKVVISDPTFTWKKYTAKEGDSVTKLAVKNRICGFLIVEKNDNVKGFGTLEPGTEILVPSSYARETILYIDKQNWMPVTQIMFDDKGQFEKYEFTNLKLNLDIPESDFTKEAFSGS